jgi:hypothetical protein
VASADRDSTAAAELALARTRALDELARPGSGAAVASPLRVEAASGGGEGLVETVVGSLLGFFL